MRVKNSMIKEMIKKDIKQNISFNKVYNNINNKLKLNSVYEDVIELYKMEINNRMNSFFYGENDSLDLSIDFDKFYKEVMDSNEFKYKNDLSKKLKKVYDNSLNVSCFNIFNYYSNEKKLYDLYNVLTIEELNKLNN